jgi:hypothetical protein
VKHDYVDQKNLKEKVMLKSTHDYVDPIKIYFDFFLK